MTPKQMRSSASAIKKLEEKLGKKRDEIRKILEDVKSITDSFEDADEAMHIVASNLREAHEQLEYAADQMSQCI